MSVFGIICELNPMHNGHARLIELARRRGADTVVCIMSGNATQRGELAVMDKYLRAQAAVRSGADLVLELPYPWCASSSESFAEAGVHIASSFCDTLIFGSETGDIKILRAAAEAAASPEFKNKFGELCKSGTGAAEAYMSCLAEQGVGNVGPNDILGIDYIKAGLRFDSPLNFETVKREGAAFLSESLDEELCPSATALRRAWAQNDIDQTPEYIPQGAYGVYIKAKADGELAFMSNISSAVLFALRMLDGESLSDVAGAGGGVANRIVAAAEESTTLEELFSRLSTKRYTDAKLRRALLFCLTNVKAPLIRTLPEYTCLLGANERGRALLSKSRRGEMTVVTKPADAPRESEQFRAGARLDALFTLALEQPKPSGALLKRSAFIL